MPHLIQKDSESIFYPPLPDFSAVLHVECTLAFYYFLIMPFFSAWSGDATAGYFRTFLNLMQLFRSVFSVKEKAWR